MRGGEPRSSGAGRARSSGAGGHRRVEQEPLTAYLQAGAAQALKKHLSLSTVGDLLEHLPRRYMPRGQLSSFAELQLGQEVSIISRVLSVSTRSLHTRRGSITEVMVTDQLEASESSPQEGPVASGFSSHPRLASLAAPAEDLRQEGWGRPGRELPPGVSAVSGATMTLSFFNAWTAKKDLHVGDHVMFSGKVGEFKGRLTLTNPRYAVLADPAPGVGRGAEEDAVAERETGPIPIYPAAGSYPTDRVEHAVRTVLERVDLSALADPIPPEYARDNGLLPVGRAYELIHRPREEEDPFRAMHTFRHREALVLQTVLARRRAAEQRLAAPAYPPAAAGLAAQMEASLPFELTAGQRRVGEQISVDLAQRHPMSRLLQGDVGSGKTLVALRAMLQVAEHGGQSVLLAPTEVLATQHLHSLRRALGPLAADPDLGGLAPAGEEGILVLPASAGQEGQIGSVGVVVLTASMPQAAKRRALAQIASGAAQIVVGTHALFSEAVQFPDLGLVVVDEQHRFGVHQRHALRRSDGQEVHRLVMTATPIPRSVAMTVFGDLAVSVLDEMPAGRQEVATHVVALAEHPRWEDRLWQRAREEIDAGHQVFVVVPTIAEGDPESDETSEAVAVDAPGGASADEGQRPLHSVEGVLQDLRQRPELGKVRMASLHGRMTGAQKAETMQAMAAGETDLLVATTVIEVGVDLPKATLMIILDADRFGISTLHQLRGRIGRGGLPGVCLLVTEQEAEGASRPRLEAVAATRDGFELSQADLQLRREGDILGSSQSGSRSRLKTLSVIRDGRIIEQARTFARALVAEDPQLRGYPELAAAADRVGGQEQTEYLYQG